MNISEISFGSVPYGALSGLLSYRILVEEDSESLSQLSVSQLLKILKDDRKKLTAGWGTLSLNIVDLQNSFKVNDSVEILDSLKELNIGYIIAEVSGTEIPLYVPSVHYAILRIDQENFHKVPYFKELLYIPSKEQETINLWKGKETDTFSSPYLTSIAKSIFLEKGIDGTEYYNFIKDMRKKGIIWNVISPMMSQFKRVIYKPEEA